MVCYKTSAFSFFIGKMLVNIDFFSLVNLIMNKQVVKELLQKDVTVQNILNELKSITEDKEYRNDILNNYNLLKEKLGKVGVAERIANKILQYK